MVRLRDSWPFSLSSAPTVGNPCRPLQPESVSVVPDIARRGSVQLDEAFSNLIGRIYDCALDPGQWSSVLAEITEVVRGEMADLGVQNPLTGTIRLAAFHNWPDDLRERVMAHQHLNPSAPLGLVLPLCEPACTSRDLDIDAYHSSRFWKACFSGSDYYDYLTAVITRKATSFGWW